VAAGRDASGQMIDASMLERQLISLGPGLPLNCGIGSGPLYA
jgi:hypothetical protein